MIVIFISVSNSFGIYKKYFSEGFDYAILESARKLNTNEFKLHPQLGYISLNQRLSNDEVLAVAFQYTYRGKVYQVGEFANGGVSGTSIAQNQTNQVQAVNNNSLVVKLLKSNITDVRQPIWDLMMKIFTILVLINWHRRILDLIFYTQIPHLINYLTPIDKSIWPQEMEDRILLNTFNLDKLNFYQDPLPEGDGFFDYYLG